MGFPKFRLTYFNLTGKGEAIRLAFHIGGIPFEDKRVSMTDMPALKPELPFGQLPVLDINDLRLCQSIALMTYVARISGLMPEDDLSAAKVYQVLGAIEDIWTNCSSAFRETDGVRKAQLMEDLGETVFPQWAERMERLVHRDGRNGCCVGEKITIADLMMYCAMNWIVYADDSYFDTVSKDALKSCPSIEKVVETVGNHPKVKEWNSMKH